MSDEEAKGSQVTGSGNFPPGRLLRPEVRMNKEQEEAVGICFRCGTDDCLQSECPGPNGEMYKEEAVMKRLTAEEFDALEKLVASVDLLHGHFVDGGCKSMGVAQQLSYAEEELGKAMVDNRHALLAMASRLVELEDALEFLGGVGCPIQGRSVEQVFSLADSLGWTSPTQKQGD